MEMAKGTRRAIPPDKIPHTGASDPEKVDKQIVTSLFAQGAMVAPGMLATTQTVPLKSKTQAYFRAIG